MIAPSHKKHSVNFKLNLKWTYIPPYGLFAAYRLWLAKLAIIGRYWQLKKLLSVLFFFFLDIIIFDSFLDSLVFLSHSNSIFSSGKLKKINNNSFHTTALTWFLYKTFFLISVVMFTFINVCVHLLLKKTNENTYTLVYLKLKKAFKCLFNYLRW